MRTIEKWLDLYGESHQNTTNKLIHWICVPLILFSIVALLYSIPVAGTRTLWVNWATILLGFTLIYYLRMSFSLFLGFAFVAVAMVSISHNMAMGMGIGGLRFTAVLIFILAWIGQFVGHKIEGKKPSFFEDLQFLLIGPAWLLSHLYKKVGIPV